MKVLILISLCLWLAACGQRGALYLPEERSTEVAPAAEQTTPSEEPGEKKPKETPPPAKD